MEQTGQIEDVPAKKSRPPILDTQIEKGINLRRRVYESIVVEFRLLILNAIWKGGKRAQESTSVSLLVQGGWPPLVGDQFASKTFQASNEVEDEFEALGYELDPSYKKTHREKRKVTVLQMTISNLQSKDPYWAFKKYNQVKREQIQRKSRVPVINVLVHK